MKCRQCETELFIDHVEKSEDGRIEQYIYVCMNPRCAEYRKAQTLMGDAAECRIKPKTVQK